MTRAPQPARKTIGLVAHDNKKRDLIDWARFNLDLLHGHLLVATGTTGPRSRRRSTSRSRRLQAARSGGDQQIGALIAEGHLDVLIFFWDPLKQQPHDPDVKALLRIAVVWNIPVACDLATADFMISSPLLESATYARAAPDFSAHLERAITRQAAARYARPAPRNQDRRTRSRASPDNCGCPNRAFRSPGSKQAWT